MNDKERIEELNNAEAHIEIDVKGLTPEIKMNINGGAALLIAANALIVSMAKLGEITPYEALAVVKSFIDDTKSFVGESKEQLEGIQEILKQREEK